MPVKQCEEWELTVHLYIAQAKAGLKPIDMRHYPSREWDNLDDKARAYSSHSFMFSNPPSRDDFRWVVNTTPWASEYRTDLLPLLEGELNQWPMIDYGHKAGSEYLYDSTGLEVGRVEVRRQQYYENQPYLIPFIGGDDTDPIINRLPKDKREEAEKVVDKYKNLIRERLSHKVGFTGTDVEEAIRQVLRDHGFLGKKKAAKASS